MSKDKKGTFTDKVLPYYQIILLLLLSQPFSCPPNSLKNLQLAFFHIVYLCSSIRYMIRYITYIYVHLLDISHF